MRRRLITPVWIFIVLAVGGIGIWVRIAMRPTDPTSLSLDPANLAPLSPPTVSPPVVEIDVPGDAADDYRAAIVAYDARPEACESFAADPTGDVPRAFQSVLSALGKNAVDFFIRNPAELIDYQTDHPGLQSLEDIGHLMDHTALLFHQRNQNDKAIAYFQAVYTLGRNLYVERLTFDEYTTALGLMDEAVAGLAECVDPARQADLQKLETAMRDYDSAHVQPVEQALLSADSEVTAAHAGDILRFAEQSDERMFKIEAILACGRMRYDAVRKADQLAAPKVIARQLSDPDQGVQTAAAAARDLTVEQYRTIH
jgi:hypothetical protein